MDGDAPHVLIVVGDEPPSTIELALRVAGLRVSRASLADPIMATAAKIRPDVVLIAYPAEQRDRAWNVLTVLRGSRELRAIPVVVATDDAEQVELFRDRFAGLGIAVLVDPDDTTLVAEVRRRAAS